MGAPIWAFRARKRAIELVMDLNSFLEPYGKGETGFEDKIVLPKNGGPGAHCL